VSQPHATLAPLEAIDLIADSPIRVSSCSFLDRLNNRDSDHSPISLGASESTRRLSLCKPRILKQLALRRIDAAPDLAPVTERVPTAHR
jgi:hypothetical protein